MYRNSMRNEILDWAIHILIPLIMALAVVAFVMQRIIVYGYSMEPTLKEGDNLLVEKISPRLRKFEYGDIVLIDVERPHGEKKTIIKRIIALENDTVEIRDGKVYVNGEIITEPYIKGNYTLERNPEYSKMVVPEGKVYVLGDNREAFITDSRTLGAIDVDRIIGKAVLRIYPFNKFGTLK